VKIFENRLRINTVTAMSSVSPFVGTRRMGILRVFKHAHNASTCRHTVVPSLRTWLKRPLGYCLSRQVNL